MAKQTQKEADSIQLRPEVGIELICSQIKVIESRKMISTGHFSLRFLTFVTSSVVYNGSTGLSGIVVPSIAGPPITARPSIDREPSNTTPNVDIGTVL